MLLEDEFQQQHKNMHDYSEMSYCVQSLHPGVQDFSLTSLSACECTCMYY